MIEDLFVPVLTPFRADGPVDVDVLLAHIDWIVQQGANGVMLFGTTGEGPSVSVTEKLAVARLLTSERPNLQVIGSVTESSIVDAATCVAGYNELPLVGTLILPPGYFREPAVDGLRAFFETLVPRSVHDVLAYHIPSLAPGVPVDVVADLAMWGAKDSSGDLSYTTAVLETGKNVMVGAEATIPDAMTAGASGTIAGMGNLLPGLLQALCRCTRGGDLATAYRLRDEVGKVQAALSAVAPGMEWVAAMKQLASHRHGAELGRPRIPLLARRNYCTPEMLRAVDEAAAAVPATV